MALDHAYLGRMIKVGEFAKARIIFDARYSPLLITTFYGNCDLQAATWHSETQNQIILEAAKKGKRVISVADATHSDRPNPDARKYWADNMSTGSPVIQAATLATFVVVSSTVVRGALTAIGWLNPEIKKIETFATLPLAISAARSRFVRERLPMPNLEPDGYQLPQGESPTAVSK